MNKMDFFTLKVLFLLLTVWWNNQCDALTTQGDLCFSFLFLKFVYSKKIYTDTSSLSHPNNKLCSWTLTVLLERVRKYRQLLNKNKRSIKRKFLKTPLKGFRIWFCGRGSKLIFIPKRCEF